MQAAILYQHRQFDEVAWLTLGGGIFQIIRQTDSRYRVVRAGPAYCWYLWTASYNQATFAAIVSLLKGGGAPL